VEESPLGGTRKRGRYKAEVIPLPDGSFRVLHPQVERAADRYDLSQDENVARFTKLLRKHRVEELLEAAGAVSGASVSIGGVDFNFSPDYVPGGDADDA
jgi:GTP-binding protein